MEKQKKQRGRPFTAGDPRAGRPKGARNKATRDVKAICTALVDDKDYQTKLVNDLRRRKLHPTIESMLWYYAKGKPKDTVKLEGGIPPFILNLKLDAGD